jgi:hypothetical protein
MACGSSSLLRLTGVSAGLAVAVLTLGSLPALSAPKPEPTPEAKAAPKPDPAPAARDRRATAHTPSRRAPVRRVTFSAAPAVTRAPAQTVARPERRPPRTAAAPAKRPAKRRHRGARPAPPTPPPAPFVRRSPPNPPLRFVSTPVVLPEPRDRALLGALALLVLVVVSTSNLGLLYAAWKRAPA